LSRGKIPLPEGFDGMVDYQQNAVVHGLKMKDVLCTREDWISRGRIEDTIRDDLDFEGRPVYITMEGVTYRAPETAASRLLQGLKKYPVYLLGPANDMIGKIITNAFEPIAPPSRVPLFWIKELQRAEIALQNDLSLNRFGIAQRLVKIMKSPLTDFEAFAAIRKSTAIVYSLWERAFEAQYDQQTSEWVTQLIDYQYDATKTLEAGPLRDNLLKAISSVKFRSMRGKGISPMEVMTHIEEAFQQTDKVKLKAPARHQLVRVGHNGPMHTELNTQLINIQYGTVRALNPENYKIDALPLSYKPWELFRQPNIELAKGRLVVACFVESDIAVSSTSQLSKESSQERPMAEISEDSREEQEVISKIPDPVTASSDDSVYTSDEDIPPIPNGIVIYSRCIKGGKGIISNPDYVAQAMAKPKMIRQVKTKQAQPNREQDKENKGALSLVQPLVSMPSRGEVSDSEDDNRERRFGRKKVAKMLQYDPSSAKRNVLAVKQDKVIAKSTTLPQQQWTAAEFRSKLKELDARHPSWCNGGM
jgi:hypothetical protein